MFLSPSFLGGARGMRSRKGSEKKDEDKRIVD